MYIETELKAGMKRANYDKGEPKIDVSGKPRLQIHVPRPVAALTNAEP